MNGLLYLLRYLYATICSAVASQYVLATCFITYGMAITGRTPDAAEDIVAIPMLGLAIIIIGLCIALPTAAVLGSLMIYAEERSKFVRLHPSLWIFVGFVAGILLAKIFSPFGANNTEAQYSILEKICGPAAWFGPSGAVGGWIFREAWMRFRPKEPWKTLSKY